MKHITIKDIAREIGMSVSTVSRALAGDKNIRSETRARVVETATRLGYRPNPVARNLKSGRTNTVGVIVPEMITPFASGIVAGVQEVLYPAGIKVLIANSYEDSAQEHVNFSMMERFMVDGIIACTVDWQKNSETIKHLRERKIPMVFYDRLPHGLDVPQVVVDDYRMAYFMTERLIRFGMHRIVHVKGPDNIYNSHERLRGFRDAMARFGLTHPAMTLEAGMDYAAGIQVADRILAACPDVDAVFSFTDIVAIGLMNRLRELGKRIPEQISVASFSGTDLSLMAYPQMSSVEQPLGEMGRKAAKMLLELIADPTLPPRTEVLTASLCMRGSTRQT